MAMNFLLHRKQSFLGSTLLILFISSFVTGCESSATKPLSTYSESIAIDQSIPVKRLASTNHKVARSRNGMVVSAHPLATIAGVRVLERGGNAADAAVAAAFALAVVEPSMNGIGGRSQVLIHTPDGQVLGIDATTQVPLEYHPPNPEDDKPHSRYGYDTIGVPGTVAGLIKLLEEHGSLSLPVVMASAIDYAEQGYRLLTYHARLHLMGSRQLSRSKGARQAFLKSDLSTYREGELLRQPELARTLTRIARGGRDAFYEGEIAREIVQDMARHGGHVSAASLKRYVAEDSRIVKGTYRGYDLVALDTPAAGAIAIEALHILGNFKRDEYTDVEWGLIVAQALGLAIPETRTLHSIDASRRATSQAWATRQASRIKLSPDPVSLNSDFYSPLMIRQDDKGNTSHLSVVDKDGMAISLTQTIGPIMGSRIATTGLGFLYAVTMGGYLGDIEPGERVSSGITPLMLFQDGQPVLVLGASGGLRIISAVVQAVTRFVDDDMTIEDAISAPKVHPIFDEKFTQSGISMESSADFGWSVNEMSHAREYGFVIKPENYFGVLGAIQYNSDSKSWTGVADPHGEGHAAAPILDDGNQN
jgi:gamma-glutamyltranspeptidase/glutathione hydrolase